MKTVVTVGNPRTTQCQKPTGLLGRFVLWRMNASHSSVTDWGLAHVTIEKNFTVLDIGCGGGRTIGKLAAAATEGKVYGVDYSQEAVAASKRTNAQLVTNGRIEVRHGSVSQLPFPVRSCHGSGNALLVARSARRYARSFPRCEDWREAGGDRGSLSRSKHDGCKAR